jgi:hypothetical protein
MSGVSKLESLSLEQAIPAAVEGWDPGSGLPELRRVRELLRAAPDRLQRRKPTRGAARDYVDHRPGGLQSRVECQEAVPQKMRPKRSF